MTFVTPALVCGDKSLTDVVAHEIAHSWTGNLVTNATSNHFWCVCACCMPGYVCVIVYTHGGA